MPSHEALGGTLLVLGVTAGLVGLLLLIGLRQPKEQPTPNARQPPHDGQTGNADRNLSAGKAEHDGDTEHRSQQKHGKAAAVANVIASGIRNIGGTFPHFDSGVWQAVFSGILVLETVIVIFLYVGLLTSAQDQTGATSQAVSAAERANTIATQALIRSTRPWVGLDGDLAVVKAPVIGADGSLDVIFAYQLKNSGPSVARHVSVSSKFFAPHSERNRVLAELRETARRFNEGGPRYAAGDAIFPNNTQVRTETLHAGRESITSPTMTLNIIGLINYWDQFDQVHQTTFEFFYISPTSTGFPRTDDPMGRFVPYGGDAD